MNFSEALNELKWGKRLRRSGWNGSGMFIYLVSGSEFVVNRPPLDQHLKHGTKVQYRPHIDMRDAEGKFVPWLASQTDLLANDWEIVDYKGS